MDGCKPLILGADASVSHSLCGADLDVICAKTDGYSAGAYTRPLFSST